MAFQTTNKSDHDYANPSECLICFAEDRELEELESRIQYLEWRYTTI